MCSHCMAHREFLDELEALVSRLGVKVEPSLDCEKMKYKDAEYYQCIRDEINRLHKLMQTAHKDFRLGFSLTIGGVLNAYREGDLSFDEASNLLKLRDDIPVQY